MLFRSMAAGHLVENDGKQWTITLREGLRFHDGEPVLARDAVASILRFGARDSFGKTLMAATDELSGTPVSAIPPSMKAKETPAWTAMMGGARAGFDDIARVAHEGAPPSELIGMLGETMRNCVACHQSYRLATE